jgi:hypothetical protein
MLISYVESSILVGCAHNVLRLVLRLSLFWSILFFLLSILQGHREVVMEVSKGPAALTGLKAMGCENMPPSIRRFMVKEVTNRK